MDQYDVQGKGWQDFLAELLQNVLGNDRWDIQVKDWQDCLGKLLQNILGMTSEV